ncbi:MAG: hypothetical protein JWN72_882 [Thermoleophilia bacterium]|nr:hypothetical protein [Thermoleophilia bacterium]
MTYEMQANKVTTMRRLMLATTLGVAALLLPATAGAATSLTVGASATHVANGGSTVLSGVAAPAGVPSEQLVVTARAASGAWLKVGVVTTAADGSGTWSLKVAPARSTEYRVQSVDAAVASTPVKVGVAPTLRLATVGSATAYYPVTVQVSVLPRTFNGTVRVRLDGAGTKLATTTIAVRNGVGRKVVTPKGAGRFRLRGTTSSADWDRTAASARFAAAGRTLRVGSAGPDVRALQSRLAALGFLTPRSGDRYSFATSEVTLAFQKSYGLSRTYVWGSREWAKLATLKRGPKARFTDGGRVHIEVDKSRQTLTVAKGSRVLGIIAVSTGATGNTPVGTFHIYQRGGSYLYRFMAFHGEFGIHGYDPVPAHPASHGCVREPNWAASFTWNHSAIGTPVHVFT